MLYKNLKKLASILQNFLGSYIKKVYKIPSGLAFQIKENSFLVFLYNPPGLYLLERKDIPILEEINLPILETKIIDLKLKKDDKILALKLLDPKTNSIYYLIFEITGRNSNVILLNSQKKVIYIFRPFKSQVRNIEVGKSYKFPPIFIDVSKENLPFSYEEEKDKAKQAIKKQVLNAFNQKILNLKNKIKTLEEKIEKLEVSETPEKYLNLANLIKANLYKYNSDEHYEKIEIIDYNNNKQIKISLDPKYTLKQNLNNLYKKYKKLKRKLENLKNIKITLEDKKKQIQNLIFYLEKQRENNLFDEKLLKLLFQKKEKKEKDSLEENVYIIQSPSKKLIFIGKNEKGNQKILKELGNKQDIWFHTKDYPGSHIILKLDKNYDNLEEAYKENQKDFLYAAKLAKVFSKLYKNLSFEEKVKNLQKLLEDKKKVEVDFTFLKNVRKIKGTTSKVTYKNYKTLLV